jgi:hypothetical protein
MLYCEVSEKVVGPIKEGDHAMIDFDIKNVGDSTVTITRPYSSCGCSTPIIPKNKVEPGETITLRIEFDSLGKVGMSTKSAGLFYDDKKKVSVKFTTEVVK